MTTDRRPAPSWLWSVDEIKRKELLSKRDSHGKPLWKIDPVPAAEVLRRPITAPSDLAVAKLGLLAELQQSPITRACSICATPMSPERAIQVCDGCHKLHVR